MALPSNAHLNIHPFVGYCRHDYPPSPVIYNFIDFSVVHGVTGLFAWPTAAFPYPPAKKPDRGGILDMGLPMEGAGTDATFIVPHVPVPPMMSYMLPLLILFGSSEILMASSKTRIWCRGLVLAGELEKPVGCCMFPYIPLSLNLQCWDIKRGASSIGAPMPTDVVVAPNTVQVGISFSDYVAVILEWGTQVLLAVLMSSGPKKKPKKAKPLSQKTLARANRAADKAEAKALKKALAKGMSKEAAEASAKAAKKAAFEHASKSVGKIYAKAMGKVAYKVLVANSEWYREAKEEISEDVNRDIRDVL